MMSQHQQPSDDRDNNSRGRFSGAGIPSDVAAENRGTNVPTRFVGDPCGTIKENAHPRTPTPLRSRLARCAELLAIVVFVAFAVWASGFAGRTPPLTHSNDAPIANWQKPSTNRTPGVAITSKDRIEESTASRQGDQDTNDENEQRQALLHNTQALIDKLMDKERPTSDVGNSATASPQEQASAQRSNSADETRKVAWLRELTFAAIGGPQSNSSQHRSHLSSDDLTVSEQASNEINRLAKWFDLPKDKFLFSVEHESARLFIPLLHKIPEWHDLNTAQRINVVRFVADNFQRGSGDAFLSRLAAKLSHDKSPLIQSDTSQKNLASISQSAIPLTPTEVSKAIRTCARYIETAIPATPEQIVGFHPAEHGINANVWSPLPTAQKIETMYLAAERSVQPSGTWVLATLAKTNAQAHDSVKFEPALQRLLQIDVPNQPLTFALPEPPTPANRLAAGEQEKIGDLSKYLSARFCGPSNALQQLFQLPSSEAAQRLIAARSFPKALEYELSSFRPERRQHWYLKMTLDVSRVFDSVRLERSLQSEVAALDAVAIRQKSNPTTPGARHPWLPHQYESVTDGVLLPDLMPERGRGNTVMPRGRSDILLQKGPLQNPSVPRFAVPPVRPPVQSAPAATPHLPFKGR